MPNRTQIRKKSRRPKGTAVPPVLSGTTANLSRQVGVVFPRHLRRRLNYVDWVNLTSTSGGQAYYQFRANSLFDPDFSSTGHQPRGYDQLCAAAGPYLTYRVHSLSVRISVTPSTASVWSIAAGFSDLDTLSSGITGDGIALSYAEQPGWIGDTIPNGSGPTKEMTFKATLGQIHNVPETSIRTEDNYAAAYNANPVDTAYFTIVGCTPSSTDTLFVGVYIEYDVTFEDPALLGYS